MQHRNTHLPRHVWRWLASVSSVLFLGQTLMAGAQQAHVQSQWKNAPTPEAMQQMAELMFEKSQRTPAQRKIDSQLLYTAKMRRGLPITPHVLRLETAVKTDAAGGTVVDIRSKVTEALYAKIRQVGGSLINSVSEYDSVRAQLPLAALESVAALPEVRWIQPAAQAYFFTGSVTSEGYVTHGIDKLYQSYGITGKGIKVGVLSDGIGGLANSQALGDLGTVTVVNNQTGSGSEGTAMLEVIHDLAPDADLYFATAQGGQAKMAANIKALRDAGCNIIIDDTTYDTEAPFQDDIVAQAVIDVMGTGVSYFSAAGNFGNVGTPTNTSACVWEGNYNDSGQQISYGGIPWGDFHLWPDNTTLSSVLQSNGTVKLAWSDPITGSSNDYDLFLLNPTGSTIVNASTNVQDGSAGATPYETITGANQNQRVAIVPDEFNSPSGTVEPRYLRLTLEIANSNKQQLQFVSNGQIFGHAAVKDAFAVTATDALKSYPSLFVGGTTNPIERSSSDGPRRVFYKPDGTPYTPGNFLGPSGGQGRIKPDIAAADNVKTTLATYNPFKGTSAAAAHAGAIAALIRSYQPNITAAQLRQALTTTALDTMTTGRTSLQAMESSMPTRSSRSSWLPTATLP